MGIDGRAKLGHKCPVRVGIVRMGARLQAKLGWMLRGRRIEGRLSRVHCGENSKPAGQVGILGEMIEAAD